MFCLLYFAFIRSTYDYVLHFDLLDLRGPTSNGKRNGRGGKREGIGGGNGRGGKGRRGSPALRWYAPRMVNPALLLRRIRTGFGVGTPDSDDFQKLMETFLSKDTSIKYIIFMKSRSVFQRYEPNCGKVPYLSMLEDISFF